MRWREQGPPRHHILTQLLKFVPNGSLDKYLQDNTTFSVLKIPLCKGEIKTAHFSETTKQSHVMISSFVDSSFIHFFPTLQIVATCMQIFPKNFTLFCCTHVFYNPWFPLSPPNFVDFIIIVKILFYFGLEDFNVILHFIFKLVDANCILLFLEHDIDM